MDTSSLRASRRLELISRLAQLAHSQSLLQKSPLLKQSQQSFRHFDFLQLHLSLRRRSGLGGGAWMDTKGLSLRMSWKRLFLLSWMELSCPSSILQPSHLPPRLVSRLYFCCGSLRSITTLPSSPISQLTRRECAGSDNSLISIRYYIPPISLRTYINNKLPSSCLPSILTQFNALFIKKGRGRGEEGWRWAVQSDIIMGNNPASREKASGEQQMLVGFENKPLTLCYANSILQVLFHHPVFSDIVRSSKFSEGILFHLKELLEAMDQRKRNESVSTSKLMRFIEKESAIFERERHQDCHQFYIWLMNSINDQIKGKDNKGEKGKQRQPTPLEEEFFSKRVTVTQCQVCNTISEREEEEVDLSLVLPEPNVSLSYCISNYSKGEKLAGRDKFKCDKCGELVEAVKATHIKTLPNFLSVHLRRFKYDEYKRGITKLVWQIPFPFKLRVATTYTKPPVDSMYKLVGVVVHLGTGENYGHYLSYIKIGQKWFVFNDDEITETECYLLESLWGYKGLSKCAYMLFYSL